MNPSFLYRITGCAFVAACFLFACSQDKGSTKSTSSAQNGHLRMVKILDSIYRNANPIDCYNLNGRLAAMHGSRIPNAKTPEEGVGLRYSYAEQLLFSGQTETALLELEQAMALFNNTLLPNTKPFFDLYAIANLRLGEQQNCVQNHTSASCIIPIQGEGIHKLPQGSSRAITEYTRILNQFPDDLQARWLLNVAYMTLGKYPSEVPAKWLIPPSVFKGDAAFHFKDVAIPLGLDLRGVSGGVCMEDFDGDDDLDLFITSYLLNDQARYFVNNGDGSFTEKTKEANLTGIVSGLNTLHADYDNDGDRDVFILRGGWLTGGTHPNSLLRNNGDGTFTDVTIEAGLLSFHPTQTGVWADFNADGWLDLFVGNEHSRNRPHASELFLSNKNGTFTNVAKQAGVETLAFVKSAVSADINNDQLPDLYLSCLNGPNVLYINRTGADGMPKFEEAAAKAGVQNPIASFPAFFFDYDNDGFEDLFVSGYDSKNLNNAAGLAVAEYMGKLPPGDYLRLYHNNGNETFSDVTKAMGLTGKVAFSMGHNFGDLDNDGWLDFYLGTGTPDLGSIVPNRMFRNNGGKKFDEVSMGNFSHIQKGHGIAFGDLDFDGDQDIYTVMGGAYEGDQANNLLFENPGNDQNKWLTVFAEGKTCNRDAFGSKIVVTVKTTNGALRKIFNSVGTGGSFGASSLRQEIGLGDAQSIESVEIIWAKPAASSTVVQNIQPNSMIVIMEGNNTAVNKQKTPFRMTGAGSDGHHHHHH